MVAGKYSPIVEDDEWFIGTNRLLEFQVFQDDGSTVQAITGWELEWMLRQSPASDTVFITKTTGDGITITDDQNGIFQVEVTEADTLDITPGGGEYWHSAKRTNDSFEDVIVYGEAVIRYAATR